MKSASNNFYYVLTVAIFITLKIAYTMAHTVDINFLLYPTDLLISFFTNSESYWINSSGYLHKDLNIIIDKSCAGFNFWLLCFVMISFSLLDFLSKNWFKIFVIPTVLILTYLLTILVNSSRILLAIFIQQLNIRSINNQTWLHQAEGVFIYLFFLIVIYITTQFIFKKLANHYAKLT